MAINAQEFQGQWNQLRGQVKKKWGMLTDDDLSMSDGNVDQLVGKIQKKTGEARDAVERYLGELSSKGPSNAASTVSGFAESARSYASQATDQMRDGYGRAGDQVRDGYRQAEDMVKSSPAQALAMAFGVGVVVGLLVGPSFKR